MFFIHIVDANYVYLKSINQLKANMVRFISNFRLIMAYAHDEFIHAEYPRFTGTHLWHV